MSDKFDDKVVLITGAAGGIGSALSDVFSAHGAIIAASDRDGSGLAADTSFLGDLTNPAFCDALPQMVYDRYGRLDIIINNAGVIARGDVTASTDDDLRLSMAVNVEAPFRICRASIPLMASGGGGAIVNIASCWGRRPGPNHALYCMTKAALASLTECMGMDHAHQNIRVNGICPNEVNTPMLRSGFAMRGMNPDTAVEALNKTVPLGRIAEPQDIADVALFLASDSARYMCGALVEVNGGKPVA